MSKRVAANVCKRSFRTILFLIRNRLPDLLREPFCHAFCLQTRGVAKSPALVHSARAQPSKTPCLQFDRAHWAQQVGLWA